jgi:glycosyltransferase involved in cell wall biosynthesis
MFDIVMPLFNKEIYVARTIESVLGQTCGDWTLFVVDDGSGDGGPAVVEQFNDTRINIIRQQNAGPGAARNTGIMAGEAEFIAFLDADDLWLPNHLETLDELRRQFPAASLIGTAYQNWSGESVRSVRSGHVSVRMIRYFHEAAQGRPPFFTSSAAFSRSAVQRVGLLEHVVIGDEMDLWARLALDGPVAASTKKTVLYRVGTGGITDSSNLVEAARVEEISLPTATLVKRLDGISDPQLRLDVEEYIDFDIGLALMRAVRTGRITYARRLLNLFLVGPRGKARTAAMLAKLPAPLGQWALHLAFGLKRALRLTAG